MADRTEGLRDTAAQCLALAQSTPDPRTRAALITMAQKLHEMANDRPGAFGAAQHEFNDGQMLPRQTRQPQPPTQQQQQIQPQKKKSRRPLYDLAMRRGLSSGCCSSAWACAYREPWGHPQGSFIGDLAKLCPFSAILFRPGFMERSYSDGGSVLIPKLLS
jgi:hypothetical protein